MATLADLILPVFGILLFGWAATFTRLIDATASKVLATFVFWFVIPVLLFRLLAPTQLPEIIAWATLAAYVGGITATFGCVLVAARLAGWRLDRAGITGFSAAFGNTFLLGTPIVLERFGPEAALPFFMIMTVDSIWLFALVTISLELGRGPTGGGARRLALTIVQRLATNPILVAMVAGLAFNRSGLPLPHGLDRFMELVGQAAIPCALFATGAALRAYRLGGAIRAAAVISVLKLGVQPFLVWLLATQLLAVPPLWAAVATVTAAMPTGVNAYVFASRYAAGQSEAAAAILLSTILAVLTLWLTLVLVD
jgi:malonate transporter